MGSPGGLQQGWGCPRVHPEAGSCPRQIWGAGAGPEGFGVMGAARSCSVGWTHTCTHEAAISSPRGVWSRRRLRLHWAPRIKASLC